MNWLPILMNRHCIASISISQINWTCLIKKFNKNNNNSGSSSSIVLEMVTYHLTAKVIFQHFSFFFHLQMRLTVNILYCHPDDNDTRNTHTQKEKRPHFLPPSAIKHFQIYIFLIFICLLKSCRLPKMFGHKTQLWGKLSHLCEGACECGWWSSAFVCTCFVYLFICVYMFVYTTHSLSLSLCVLFTFVCWFHLS